MATCLQINSLLKTPNAVAPATPAASDPPPTYATTLAVVDAPATAVATPTPNATATPAPITHTAATIAIPMQTFLRIFQPLVAYACTALSF